MWLATSEDDKVALSKAKLPSLFERKDGRTTSEIVKHSVGERRQSKTPGTAKLVVEEQSPAQVNPIKHISEDVHAQAC